MEPEAGAKSWQMFEGGVLLAGQEAFLIGSEMLFRYYLDCGRENFCPKGLCERPQAPVVKGKIRV